MKLVLNPEQVRVSEKQTMKVCNMTEIELVEKAAFCLTQEILNTYPEANRFLIVIGGGNNGADGLACGRKLLEADKSVDFYFRKSKLSEANKQELVKLEACSFESIKYVDNITSNYDLLIDSIFGIGLNRDLAIEDIKLIEDINSAGVPVVSVDIPSGLNASTGTPMPISVKSDLTVSFGYVKKGLLSGKGPEYYNRLKVCDIGLLHQQSKADYLMLEQKDIKNISFSKACAHKGTYGKVLMVVGSDKTYGAGFISSKAAFYSGAGMVKVITHINNRYSFEANLPEAMYEFYGSFVEKTALEASLKWADTVVIGCGIGINDISKSLVEYIIYSPEISNKRLVFDADSLNIISENPVFFNELCNGIMRNSTDVVFTPHKKELLRLQSGLSISDANDFYDKFGIVLIEKDAKTVIHGSDNYINTSGNDGMATAGSGDVLAGITGGLLYRLKDVNDLALVSAIAVYIHGMAGDYAAECKGKISMTASDILENIPEAFKSVIS